MAKKQEAKKQEVVAVIPPAPCAKCGETRRSDPVVMNVLERAGLLEGRPFTHIVILHSRCVCGQARISRRHENRAAAAAKA